LDILLRELDPGQKYIFQARSKSGTGKTSAWSTAFEHTTTSDTIAPSPVTSLTWDVVGTSFTATWVKPTTNSDTSILKDFKDYKVSLTADAQTVVYFVSQEKFDFPIEVNRNSFGSPEPTVEISVQARDLSGNLSTTVTDSASNPVPSNVTGFVSNGIVNAIALSWDAVTDTDLKYYEVYMETSGSGFTPGPTNLVFTGSATSFVLQSSNYVTHYFKIRAVDVFNQGSASYTSASATPESSTDIDLTPPGDPTGVTVSSTAGTDGFSSLLVEWSAVGSSNLSDYVVRYSLDEAAWIYVTVPAGTLEATINGLDPDTDYYVQVAGMSYANVKSNFVSATPYPITSAVDSAGPSQPSAPTVSTSLLMAQVSHDMAKQAGGDLEADVIYLEVHASTTTGFTPSSSTLRGTIDTAGPGIDVSGVFYFATTDSMSDLYWKVIAVDRAKNKSIASNQSTGLPGLIANVNIANATITSAKIQDLEANKIIAGTGIINDLLIKSTLTIDTAGHLQSANWNNTDTGYKLDTGGLTIYSGSISAAALLLQDSVNIMLPPFADFEFNDDYYHTSGTANTNVMSTVGTMTLSLSSTAKFGNKSIRVLNGAITNPTVHDLIFAPSGLSATGVNIDVNPGTYIFSGYFKKNGSLDASLKFGLYPDTGSAITSSAVTVNNTSWTRFEAQLVVPSGVTKVKAYLEFGPEPSNTGYDFLIDGLQLERKMTGTTTAGIWRPPSKTTIDGGQIVTGSIRSSASSPTVAGQPAWSINTAGNMQIGDALVRGTLIVGNSTSENSYVRSSNYVADTSGWTIEANGSAEFNDVAIRGILHVQGSADPDAAIDINIDVTGQPYQDFIDAEAKIYRFQTFSGTMDYLRIGHVSSPNSRLYFVDGEGIGFRSDAVGAPSVLFDDTTGFLKFGQIASSWTEEAWTNATLQNSWNTTGVGAFDPPGYKKQPDGTVRLRGVTVAGTKTDGTVIFTLPSGYRPARRKHIVVSGDTANQTPVIQIHGISDGGTAGQVQIYRMGTAGAIGLDGSTFELI
jgi:hypothetical protein